jgi:gliding motility-associated-like protein
MRLQIFLVAASGVLCLHAQELLSNGDFEQFTACPDSASQIDLAVGWSRPTVGTSDYFNACQQGIPPGFNVFDPGVPDNTLGHQAAHSGNGYAGFFCIDTVFGVPSEPYKEYVSHALASPMVPGEAYTVEFFVSLADRSALTVHDLGALFSVEKPHRDDSGPITALPQVTPDAAAALDDSVGWTRIRGCFIADSAYAWITIGSFRPPTTGLQGEQGPAAFPPAEWYSYYYVDDVSVLHLPRPDLGPDITICDATPIAVQDSLPGIDYLWSTGENGTSITVDAAGTYTVQVTDGNCPLSDTIVVALGPTVAFGMPVDTAVDLCAMPQVVLNARPDPANADVAWSTGDTTAFLWVDAAGSYSIHGTAPGYCPGMADIAVTDLCGSPLYAPNSFTPNGDGINDKWRPVWNGNADATLEWTVFDRWGQVLFTSTGPDSAWDGNAAGQPVPIGTYAWRGALYDRSTGVSRTLKGEIVLVR